MQEQLSEARPDSSGSAKRPLSGVVIIPGEVVLVPGEVVLVPVPIALVPRKQGTLSPGVPWPVLAGRSRAGAPHCPGT